jgi:hypothetical protein
MKNAAEHLLLKEEKPYAVLLNQLISLYFCTWLLDRALPTG